MKKASEFDKFDKVMDAMFSVPRKELQEKLDQERKANKERRKRRAKTSPARRDSGV